MSILTTIFIFIFVFAPLSLFIHELGHAFAANTLKADKIQLSLGAGKIIVAKEIQRYRIIVRLIYMVNSSASTIRKQPFQTREKIFITLMGPIFNVLFAIIAYLLYGLFHHDVFMFTSIFNVWLFVSNLFPFKLGSKQSDGYTIYTLLFK